MQRFSGNAGEYMINIDFTEKTKKIEKTLPYIKEKLKENLIFEPFYKDFKYSFCWSSNAIEGNTLSLSETISLLEYDEVSAGHSFREYDEAKRLYSAIEKYLSFEYKDITESWIKNIAQEVTGLSGGYRKENVYIGTLSEAIYYPPSHENINELMGEYIKYIKPFSKMQLGDKITYIAKKHIEFERIHPFLDGNGRTGRVILNQSLINESLLPIVIEPKSKYRSAFKEYNKSGDTSLMENIVYNGQLEAIEKVKLLVRNMEHTLGKSKERGLEI